MLKFIPTGPVNRHPVLESAGLPPPTFTPHTYVATRKEPDPKFGDMRPQWMQYFRCDETGVERVFGCQGPNYTESEPV